MKIFCLNRLGAAATNRVGHRLFVGGKKETWHLNPMNSEKSAVVKSSGQLTQHMFNARILLEKLKIKEQSMAGVQDSASFGNGFIRPNGRFYSHQSDDRVDTPNSAFGELPVKFMNLALRRWFPHSPVAVQRRCFRNSASWLCIGAAARDREFIKNLEEYGSSRGAAEEIVCYVSDKEAKGSSNLDEHKKDTEKRWESTLKQWEKRWEDEVKLAEKRLALYHDSMENRTDALEKQSEAATNMLNSFYFRLLTTLVAFVVVQIAWQLLKEKFFTSERKPQA